MARFASRIEVDTADGAIFCGEMDGNPCLIFGNGGTCIVFPADLAQDAAQLLLAAATGIDAAAIAEWVDDAKVEMAAWSTADTSDDDDA